MLKSIKSLLQGNKEKYRVPRSVQDIIPAKKIWTDGIFYAGGKYSMSWKFSDINYLVASREDKENMFFSYCEILNGLDSAAISKITINNHFMKQSDLENNVLMKMQHDGSDEYRKEYNEMVLGCAKDSNGIVQEKYITVSVRKRNIEEARSFFKQVGTELVRGFKALGSKCVPMDAVERLRVLHGFYRSGDENYFAFDLRTSAKRGHSFKDYICPDSLEKHKDFLMLGGKYARVVYLKDYANYVKDDFVSELMDIQRNMMLSIDILPVPKGILQAIYSNNTEASWFLLELLWKNLGKMLELLLELSYFRPFLGHFSKKSEGLKPLKFQALVGWSECRDLNPGPLGPEPSTLPSALHPENRTLK